jgi:hypothetical protein
MMIGKTHKFIPFSLLTLVFSLLCSTLLSAQSSGNAALDSGNTFLGIPVSLAVIIFLVIFFLLLGRVLALRKAVKHSRDGAEGHNDTTDHHHHDAPKTGMALKWHYIKTTINPIFVVLAILTIITGFTMVDWYHRAQDLGTQIGYSPEQPIKFNHKIHAGQYGIQCQYCHTGVEKSKQANIPSVNICMNCHNAIKSGPQYGTIEIAKVVSAYKNNTPVRWVRIHNLPDHVYFNHQQHVIAGKVKCESCHGRVQEMERVEQVATLEMGWCINCHRESKINIENPYYTSTFDFLKKHKTYTVAQMGGLECAKCHY